ncbi:YbaB/EbfC family nucleoid-associated protein [Roseiterribacter gracilis]|uniref:Nucleoid-associated protein TMPK1_16090 n=1 Tax=Roseiterribacter gracilis TaxID=2812848 RepID=A0A8S8XBG8_9PROT|nr:nucleoid-associated protein [Rhodospirillales bacterium TMPK1]
MKNLGNMMKQAQQMQARMQEMQAKLAQTEMTGQAGGGMVQVTLAGSGELRKIKLEKSVVDPNDVEMLEDLIVAACNDAKTKLDAHVQEETSKLMGGMQLPPGMKLPF